MKKISFFILLIGLVACKKEARIVEENNTANALIKAVAQLSKDNSFKNDITLKVANKFDGDYNVLLKDIDKNKRDALSTILAEFQNKGLYPQIYIPNFEEKQVLAKSRASLVPSSNKRVYVVNALDALDSQEYFNAYYIDNNNKLVAANFQIDEDFANNNEVWVISNNERVNSSGEVAPAFMRSGLAARAASNSKQREGTKSEHMMSIKCPNLRSIEGWVKGAPELRCIMKTARGEISDQYFMPRRRRDINNKWWNPNGNDGRYLFYWDTETYAKTVLFTWIEVDDAGRSIEINGSFQYKDTNKETNTDLTATTNYKFTIKGWDQQCGSISVHKDDGRVGDVYNTGKIEFITAYK